MNEVDMALRRWVTAGLAFPALLAAAVVAATPTSAAAARLVCHASMSNSHPKDYTTTDVLVRTAPRAGVTTVAHYKTVNRRHHRTANGRGRARVPYYISGATPGYKVVVDVKVRKDRRTASCSTWFIPHR